MDAIQLAQLVFIHNVRTGGALSELIYMTTRQVADRLGVHPQTLRNWERTGVVPPGMRRRGLRVYTTDDVERIRGIVFEKPSESRRAKREL
jgi:DNA-binding transcriptional regulator YiaG